MTNRQPIPKEDWYVWAGKRVVVTCPKCRQKQMLDHNIDRFGVITPSLLCGNPKCDFHAYAFLEDWPIPED